MRYRPIVICFIWLDYFHGCQGLENSIHPEEWNADAADCADTHGRAEQSSNSPAGENPA